MTIDDPDLDALLRSYQVPAPDPDTTFQLLQAAAPLLAQYARRPDWSRVARAVAVALLALPTVLGFDALLLQGLYRVLGTVLPHVASVVLTVQYGLGLLLLLGASFVLIPVVAGHATPPLVEESHV